MTDLEEKKDTPPQVNQAQLSSLAIGTGALCVALLLLCVVVVIIRRNLTLDERWIFAPIMAISAAVAGLCFSGGATLTTKSLVATGTFVIFFSFPWMFPSPKGNSPVFVTLSRPKGGAVVGGFTLHYRRQNEPANDESGKDGKLTINDLPSGVTTLEVTRLVYAGMNIDVALPSDGVYRFPIDAGGNVTIPLRSVYDPPAEPSKETVLEELKRAILSREQILAADVKSDDIERAVLVVKNETGKRFVIWVYDCVWAFKEQNPDADPISPFLDIRVSETAKTVPFKAFEEFDSKSGYFLVYVEFNEDGERKRYSIGVHNLLKPNYQQLTIEPTSGLSHPFHHEFTYPDGDPAR